MKNWSLASRILASVLAVVTSSLVFLSISVAGFTRFEVTERLDNSLQEVAERLEFVISAVSQVPNGGSVARLPDVGPRTLAYQIVDQSGHVLLRSQNAPVTPFVSTNRTGFYDSPKFRIYVTHSTSSTNDILVGEPTFHRREALRRATLISVLPMLVFLPIVWLLVHWIVRRALRPLTDLQAEIRKRGDRNLEPIGRLALPEELSTILTAVNSLLTRLKKALSTERAFAANAAQELRNPIGALLAQTQMLRDQSVDTDARERSKRIAQQVRALGRTVEKLLQLSRASSGIALQGERFDLLPVLEILADEFRGSIEQVAVIRLSHPGMEHLFIDGDMDAAGILFRNLIENAVRHGTPSEPITITATPDRTVSVENAGPILGNAKLAELKEPFVRGENPRVEGSGLGLAIAATIAEQMGAKLILLSPRPTKIDGFSAQIHFLQSAVPEQS